MMRGFPFYRQLDSMDCGPACLKAIAKYYGKVYSLEFLRIRSSQNRGGVSLLGLKDAAESIGLKTLSAKIPFDKLKNVPLPMIAFWRKNHFIVVYKISNNNVYVSDPAHGLIKYNSDEFRSGWTMESEEDSGLVLFLEPTSNFYDSNDDSEKIRDTRILFQYLNPHKRYFLQLLIGMIVGSLLQLIFPFLTQSLVDIGINQENLTFINIILIAQLILFFSRVTVDFIRNWILLHIGNKIGISLMSDFLSKLMKLPQSFFDNKLIGDLMVRLGDYRKIEAFLTTSSINILFSLINLIVFGIVLLYYNLKIFCIFFIGSALYLIWVLLFMKKRRELNNKLFSETSSTQGSFFEIINGMKDIKIYNAEAEKRDNWEKVQRKIFRTNIKNLTLNQYQQGGAFLINELKNILATFVSAQSVINGEITLGMMLSIQYIIGQMNSPISQAVGFIHSAQDAKISFERFEEIFSKEEEELIRNKTDVPPQNKTITLENISFKYPSCENFVLKNINLIIPENKITAIVGASGSGKTTLLKILLKLYKPTNGDLSIGQINLNLINGRTWRDKCGAVLQDGYIFSDSIAKNIALGEEIIDILKLSSAIEISNVKDFVNSSHLGFDTKLGADGTELSQGQRQRILIARAIYKDPDYLFFDEATNALDAKNESVIIHKLKPFYEGKTVVIVAHRLSTVASADQIIVLENGKIVEIGTHQNLIKNRGNYFNLVQNQLELGI
ncbi:MAG: peptidase domain-containing ABC transporter [Bacteroidetes bacterium]|nr:peptidase domain-containing ABC transporter [Bacteroidota bacterium]